MEGCAQEVFGFHVFHPHEIQEHVVGNAITGIQWIRITIQYTLTYGRFHLFVKHLNDQTPVILSSSTGTPRHLDVLARSDPSKVLAVEFSRVGKDHRLGGHVDADRKGLGRKERLDESLRKQNLHHLLEDRQQPAVVHSDAPLEQREQRQDLGEFLVVLPERINGIGVDLVDEVLFDVVGVVLPVQCQGESFAVLLGEGKDNDRIEVAGHDELDDPLQTRHLVVSSSPLSSGAPLSLLGVSGTQQGVGPRHVRTGGL
mmetsp:Transcript_29368/g.69007  ORF Transcript_29368/g.69007 Transcript_29368/m.69007 type:complete len:257 (-) Transcript_29368:1576-2346(-)